MLRIQAYIRPLWKATCLVLVAMMALANLHGVAHAWNSHSLEAHQADCDNHDLPQAPDTQQEHMGCGLCVLVSSPAIQVAAVSAPAANSVCEAPTVQPDPAPARSATREPQSRRGPPTGFILL